MRLLFARLATAAGKVPVLGRALRWYARWAARRKYAMGALATIRMGHLAGRKWLVYHDSRPYWLGLYEMKVQDALVRELRPGGVFYDVGAHHGFFSLLAAGRVGPDGKVFSFEPFRANVERMRELFGANGVENAEIIEAAVGGEPGEPGETAFHPGKHSATGSILEMPLARNDLTLTVSCTTLDEFAGAYPPPDVVKVDVEGAEALVLGGGRGLLSRRRARFIIELHGPRQAAEVGEILRGAGYEARSLDGRAVAPGRLPQFFVAVPAS